MIKRIWKVIVLFGSMLLICGCGKEKLSEEDILQKINTTGEYGENLEWQLYDGAFGITPVSYTHLIRREPENMVAAVLDYLSLRRLWKASISSMECRTMIMVWNSGSR